MPAYKDKTTGSWNVQFYYKDWTGKNKKKYIRGFGTKKEAQEYENSYKSQKAPCINMLFGDFWVVYTNDVKPKLKYNTWMTKQHIVETKILPYFKDRSISEITPRDIVQWQNEMRGLKTPSGKEFAGTYLKTLQSELSCIFNHAVNFYELGSNPARKAGSLGCGQADEMLFWTKEEYLQFVPTVADKPYSYYAFELYNISLSGTTTREVEYGDRIYLSISGTYDDNVLAFAGGISKVMEHPTSITIKRQTTAKQ